MCWTACRPIVLSGISPAKYATCSRREAARRAGVAAMVASAHRMSGPTLSAARRQTICVMSGPRVPRMSGLAPSDPVSRRYAVTAVSSRARCRLWIVLRLLRAPLRPVEGSTDRPMSLIFSSWLRTRKSAPLIGNIATHPDGVAAKKSRVP